MHPETFTYTIFSTERTGLGGLVSEYYIDFGGFGNYTGDYFCEVVRVTLNGNVDPNLGYVLLTAENLHKNGYHSARPSNEITLACIDVATLQTTTHGSSFIVQNCGTKRLIKFTLTNSNYAPLDSWLFGDGAGSGEINIDGNVTDWFLSLKLTPI